MQPTQGKSSPKNTLISIVCYHYSMYSNGLLLTYDCHFVKKIKILSEDITCFKIAAKLSIKKAAIQP